MTNPNLTEIICIIDRSGSMNKIRSDAIGGFNSFLKDQQQVPGDCKFTYCQFDTEYEIVHDGIPIKDMPPLTEKTYMPRGSTALLDAIGRTINVVGARLASTPESDRPGKVIVVILTDGEENASQEFKREQIFKMITTQREQFAWEFVFLAANQDAIQGGALLGIPKAAAANFSADAYGAQHVYTNLSKGVSSYRTGASCHTEVADAVSGSQNATSSSRIKH